MGKLIVANFDPFLKYGRSISDNFKRRFGDPARIKIQMETKKPSFSEESYRSQKISEASIDILRSVLWREPTQNEILGKVDIAKASPERKAGNNGT